jgi:hypothetical protein
MLAGNGSLVNRAFGTKRFNFLYLHQGNNTCMELNKMQDLLYCIAQKNLIVIIMIQLRSQAN